MKKSLNEIKESLKGEYGKIKKVSDLVPGNIYTYYYLENTLYIYRCIKNTKNNMGVYLTSNDFCTSGSLQVENYMPLTRLSSIEETHWFEACEYNRKFIPFLDISQFNTYILY